MVPRARKPLAQLGEILGDIVFTGMVFGIRKIIPDWRDHTLLTLRSGFIPSKI